MVNVLLGRYKHRKKIILKQVNWTLVQMIDLNFKK